jgi:hypothetical protein
VHAACFLVEFRASSHQNGTFLGLHSSSAYSMLWLQCDCNTHMLKMPLHGNSCMRLLCKSPHHAPDTLLTTLPAHNPCRQGLPSSPCPDGYRTATLQCNPIQLTVPPHSTHLGYVLPRDVSDLLADPLFSRIRLRVFLYICGNKADWTRLRLRPFPFAVPALYPLQHCVSLQTLPAGTGTP